LGELEILLEGEGVKRKREGGRGKPPFLIREARLYPSLFSLTPSPFSPSNS
jgi:hypothetical protein